MERFRVLIGDPSSPPPPEELHGFLKSSKIDLLKSIAKRYKVPTTGKTKSQLIQIIQSSVTKGTPFPTDDPPLAQMSLAQLRNKAVELNIDISNLKLKQDLKLAILGKMQKTSVAPTSSTTNAHYKTLHSKTLPELKALAKQLKIKISKLSKDQLITSILEKSSAQGITSPVLLGSGAVEPSKTKSGSSSSSSPTAAMTFPLQPSDLDALKTSMTITQIRRILKEHHVKIKAGITKKDDLLRLLLQIPGQATTTTPAATTSTPSPPPASPVTEEVDIVPLEDIHSPFTPVNINDLTDTPSDEMMNRDIERCLKFYEYPSTVS